MSSSSREMDVIERLEQLTRWTCDVRRRLLRARHDADRRALQRQLEMDLTLMTSLRRQVGVAMDIEVKTDANMPAALCSTTFRSVTLPSE
ncbi:MAG TPA: hypothetical protein VGB55_09435 [Tepidisphaeraceae bacterium]|jgi:hypothetical protein